MKSVLRRTAGFVAMLTFGMVSAANADFGPVTQCGGSNFSTCASVQLAWSADGKTATITVTNIGSPSDVFTAIGLTGLDATQAVTSAYNIQVTASTDATTLWNEGGTELSGDGILQGVAQAQSVSGRSVAGSNRNYSTLANGLADGQTLTIVFTFNTEVANRTSVGVAFHAQSGPNGCSTKLVFDAGGTPLNNVGTDGYSACTSTVPEPATIGLLTTGLLGLGGVGFLRRRKKA